MNVSKVLADNLLRTTEEKQWQSYGEFCLHHKLIFMSVQQLAQLLSWIPDNDSVGAAAAPAAWTMPLYYDSAATRTLQP